VHTANLRVKASRQSINSYSTLLQTLVRVFTVFSIRTSSSSKLKFVSGKALFQSILFNAHLETKFIIVNKNIPTQCLDIITELNKNVLILYQTSIILLSNKYQMVKEA